jgi:hypothetical protein
VLTAGGPWRQVLEKVYRQRLRKANFLHLDPNLKGTDNIYSAGSRLGSRTITPAASGEELSTTANNLARGLAGTGFALGALHVACRMGMPAVWFTTRGAVGLRARCAAYLLHPPAAMRHAKEPRGPQLSTALHSSGLEPNRKGARVRLLARTESPLCFHGQAFICLLASILLHGRCFPS